MSNQKTKPRAVLQIFAKYPQAGKVNTRLIEYLGADQAMNLYVELLQNKLAMAQGLPFRVDSELWCTEAASASFYRRCFQAWPRLRYRRQVGGMLGERLEQALKRSLSYHGIVVQIGADCPALSRKHILEAIDIVSRDETACFIPAEDGGYVLAAYPDYFQGMFDSIAWGGETVMSDTARNFFESGYEIQQTAPLWDIDRPEDVERYRTFINRPV